MENNKTKQKAKTLGRGLELLFDGDIRATLAEIENKSPSELKESNISISEIEISRLVPNPYQPRKIFNNVQLNELASSIKENGIFTPIIVKETIGNRYYIVAGERRVRAARIAKLKTIPAIVSQITDRSMQVITLIENMQRSDLNPIEEGQAIKGLMISQDLTQDEIAKIIGKSRSFVANALRLVNSDRNLVSGVLKGEFNYGHARPLIGMDKDFIVEIIARIINEKLSVREVENIAKSFRIKNTKEDNNALSPIKVYREIKHVEGLLGEHVKSDVEITNNKIIIKYNDQEQLNRILRRLNSLDK
ncbi:MAG: ParB/RepB/Spo0J family partition protein [Mycoplasmataceae bacterium]|nr:ParB/RepB/Spo0J family partition protein [Mycoplasmataceae bacterium]